MSKEWCDFMIWYKAHDDDPKDFVSLFVHTERARQWCYENDIDEYDAHDMENSEARALRDRLLAAGFEVWGCS